ncbi:MAG: hypothetical protein Q8R10_05680 [Pseudomonas sp.]|uniref:hypothetical protein n=1 Tax=Pseudomonas sp. TaxID=306 RepID=UPI00273332BD|nr:hypothetical protein [Pseudomonas sp.]MDP3845899.1 hypothetical protein [Pseudomonas sp.]
MATLDKNSVISTCLFHINVDKNSKEEIKTDLNILDLETYLETLLVEINSKEQKRLFEVSIQDSAFKTTITTISATSKLDTESIGEALAERLLQKEKDVSIKYGHLSKNDGIHVKVGSFLQFTYTENGNLRYIGVKVDHQVILDQADFKKKTGLGLSEKIYKAFKVEFNAEKKPENIYIYDSKSKLTQYWWHEFLELKEKNTDTHNTSTASQAVISKIAILKKDFPQDHTILRNATIAAFKQNGSMDYTKFIDDNFLNYTSDNPEFEKKKPQLLKKLHELPETKGFDTLFNLVPSAVPFRKTTYKLSQDIALIIKDGIGKLDEKVWAERTADGRHLVVIESNESRNFKLKERVL